MKNKKSSWEIKDRTYILANGKSPVTWTIQTKHTRRKPLLWFDEENNVNKEIRYATNQNSLFVDEQDGYVTLGHIFFEDGTLYVPRNKQPLQKLLSVYHPDAGKTWIELDLNKNAVDELDIIELELDALNLVADIEEEQLIAILRTEYGSSVADYTPAQIKRLGFRMAKTNPKLFIDLAADEDVQLRNFANMAVEMGLINLTDGNTTFKYASNGRKIFTVPFDQNPFLALAQYFKTDEGAELYKALEAKMK